MNVPEPERPSAAATDSRRALARVVAEVHQRWGAGSLTYSGAIVPRTTVGDVYTPGIGVPPPPPPYRNPHATPNPPYQDDHLAGELQQVGNEVAVAAQTDGGRRSIRWACDEIQTASPVIKVGEGRAGPLPPWWPGAKSREGRPLPVPPILEVGVATGAGRLTFMLAWAAALRPNLLAIIDGAPVEDGARLYPPAVMASGLPSTCRPIVVRPGGDTASPRGTVREVTRAIVDALCILLRSEAFDAILCPMPTGARLSTATATTLASMAARAGTALVVMTGLGAGARRAEPPALLGPSAAYRLVIADHRWAWRDGELAGLRLEVHTHRARGGAEASLSQSIASALVPRGAASTARRGTNTHALATHILDFRLRRIMRDGPAPGAMGGGIDGTSWELSGVSARRFTEDEGDDTPDTLFASAV